MKHTLFILALITATIQTFAQSPRIKLNQITKDSVTGSVLISSPTDSGMVYSRDLFISYGADTFLILGEDTIILQSDLIAEIGDSLVNYVSRTELSDSLTFYVSRNELSDSTTNIRTDIPLIIADSLLNYVTVAGTQTITGAKTFSTDVEIDGKLDLDDGSNRVFVGTSAGSSNTGVESNGFGYQALQNNTGASSNGFGTYALENNTGASSNGFGYFALENNTGTSSNGFGNYALTNNTGGNSNGFGRFALANNTGTSSNGFGYAALINNTGGNSNGFGYFALENNTGASSNGFGYFALENNTGTSSNGFGLFALRNNKAANNTAIGHQAGYEVSDLTGGSNTFLGYNASYGANTTITNATAVGANVTLSNSNTVILGNGANVGIGTTSPNYDLEVVGKIYASDSIISNVYAGISDIRLKQDIEITDKGLDAVMELNPVSYRFIANADSEKKSYGFIAQEIEKVIPDVVGTRHDGMKVLNYNDLISVLTKAIQEQQIIIEELNQRLIKLENK